MFSRACIVSKISISIGETPYKSRLVNPVTPPIDFRITSISNESTTLPIIVRDVITDFSFSIELLNCMIFKSSNAEVSLNPEVVFSSSLIMILTDASYIGVVYLR